MTRLFMSGVTCMLALWLASSANAAPPTGPKTHGNPHTTTHATPAAKTHGNPHGTTPAGQVTGQSVVPHNQKLVARLQGMLPNGLSVENAAAGFKNQGQFVAAVHVSHNLGIPFDDLKTHMVTGGESLGGAIHTLKPSADHDAEAKRAIAEADEDLDDH